MRGVSFIPLIIDSRAILENSQTCSLILCPQTPGIQLHVCRTVPQCIFHLSQYIIVSYICRCEKSAGNCHGGRRVALGGGARCSADASARWPRRWTISCGRRRFPRSGALGCAASPPPPSGTSEHLWQLTGRRGLGIQTAVWWTFDLAGFPRGAVSGCGFWKLVPLDEQVVLTSLPTGKWAKRAKRPSIWGCLVRCFL